MWRFLWRSIDRFSVQHFKFVINELREIHLVDKHNRELVVDLLQSVVEIVTYGDQQDPLIFECFMEYQVLAEFVRVLKISRNSRIEGPLLQYLSIMIQNMDSEQAIYYCLSNDHINSIITHEYKFDEGELVPYYISFLRAVSNKLNRDTICLLVKVQGDAVVSFPLYTEAVKFTKHGEKMIQTAVRALTLNIYNVSDNMVCQFISTPPASEYFSDLVNSLKDKCSHLDSLVLATESMCANQRRKELLLETDKVVDDLYYIKDILCVGESSLSEVVNQNLLNLFVVPTLLPLLRQNDVSNLSPIASLYIVSLLLQVVGGKNVVNTVAEIVLYHFMSSLRDSCDGISEKSFSKHLNNVEKLLCSCSELEGAENIDVNLFSKHTLWNSHFGNCWVDDNVCPERRGVLAFIFSGNHCLLLASLFLLLTLAGSKDVENSLASMIELSAIKQGMDKSISASPVVNGGILVKFMPQILNELLKILASEPSTSFQTQWHAGWFLHRLLISQGKSLDHNNLLMFNTSYEKSHERFQKELDGCWFDYILETLRNEWTSCKTALEKPSQSQDPFFLLELAICQQITDGNATSSYVTWQKMVKVVKVFILHLQLKAFIFNGELLQKPVLAPQSTSVDSGKRYSSDLSSASFGSEIPLGSGIPCRIAFSNVGVRDVYMILAVRGTSGKFFLVEKHPFRSQRGIVIAMAPLAALNPKIDEDHPTWLHLRIRDFDPSLNGSKTRAYNSEGSNQSVDGRWTLGFSNAKACEAAQCTILAEVNKQKNSIRTALSSLIEEKSDEES